MTVAVIDLGTNTFHLLVAQMRGTELKVVLRERRFVKLGQDGVGILSPETLERARVCLEFFKEKLTKFRGIHIRAIGTAALRTSANAQAISKMVNTLFKSDLEIIDGQREAELIYKGVSFHGYPNAEKNMIIDIGGGSIEFIIFKKEKVLYQNSFNIGIGWMHHRFRQSDPIRREEILELENHLDNELQELQEALNLHLPDLIIGASGTFDLLFHFQQVFEQTECEGNVIYA
jgi:exopolyphosphatase/guanosine-5'-triphosphate,3'-diphosphate pyrophosphatase